MSKDKKKGQQRRAKKRGERKSRRKRRPKPYPGMQVKSKAVGTTPCPCGGTVTVTENSDGIPDTILHTLPYCESFEQLDPLDYLRWCRGHREGHFDA